MFTGKVRLTLTATILALALILFSSPTLAGNGASGDTADQLVGVLNDAYGSLPDVEFEFGPPTVSYGDLEVTAHRNLAISKPNLSDGLVLGLANYDGKPHLLMASSVPEDMEYGYAVGLVDLSTEEIVFAAFAELVDQEGASEELGFEVNDPGEELETVDFEIAGRRYLLRSSLPKSL